MSEDPLNANIRNTIISRLKQIARDEKIKILYACESGSRAWGFPSKDSDYDVRFIYVRTAKEYLSIDASAKRDTIERPIEDEIDLSGWDLAKALGLMRKSNPSLLEWLASPIAYVHTPYAKELRALSEKCFSPRACAWHYLSMARSNQRSYLGEATVHPKKYFYVLRPLLAVQWIEAGLGPVPMLFDQLVHRLIPSGPLADAIRALTERKKAEKELDKGPRIEILHHYLEEELARRESPTAKAPDELFPVEPLNRFFRKCLGVRL